ncbi:hypothetical protein L195_g052609, partial [Trifolium pratense]
RDILSIGRTADEEWFKSNVGCCVGDDRLSRNVADTEWHWQWYEELSDNDAHHLQALKQLLLDNPFDQARSDRWRWVPDSVGLFTVKSCYSLLLQYSNTVVSIKN